MHVRIRCYGEPDRIVAVQSKLKKIEQLKLIIEEKYNIARESQRLFYGGKLLENDYTFYDYNIKLNDVIQLVVNTQFSPSTLQEEEVNVMSKEQNTEEDLNSYLDAESSLYEKEDLVDVKHNKQGKWQEGKIIRIVHDPMSSREDNDETNQREQDVENHQSNLKIGEDKNNELTKVDKQKTGKLLYKIQLDNDEHESEYYKESDIRPRARTALDINEIKIGQMVMVNYNIELPDEKGDWYDFKVEKIRTVKKNTEIVGTLYFGEDLVPQHNTKIRVHDKIFSIEEAVQVAQRTEEYNAVMKTQPEQRSKPILCNFCRDDESVSCRECGCIVCSGKHEPAKILLCDECNSGYHIDCLQQPEKKLPDGDWYCPNCVRDTTAIVAPGASAQPRKKLNTSRDWGRGMACAGKTKTCAMPSNHFGPIPGIEVGMCWRFRIQLSESGVHRPPVSGIHGRDVQGAFSIVLSGGYEDDVDNGDEFTYTGSGGRDLSGNKRTAGQSSDQTLTRENRALARNCAAGEISEAGGDAGDAWRLGKPVRVVRSYKMLRHFPKYAPSEGIRYDGIYKVVKYYPENGLSGYKVWKYLLRRDDPSPAPWERGAKKYPVIYPDGYLEAEAEKRALMEKKAKTTKRGKKSTVKNNLSNYMSEEVATNSNVLNNPKEDTTSRKSEIKEKISSLNGQQTDNIEEPSTSKKSTRSGNKTASNDGNLPSNPMAEVVPSDETFTSAKDKKFTSAGKKYVLRSRNLPSNSMSEKVASKQSVSENREEPTASKIFKKRSKKSPLSSSNLSSNSTSDEMSPKETVIEKKNQPLIFTKFTRAGKKNALNQSNLSSNTMSDVSFNQFVSENLEEPTTSTRSSRTCKKRSLRDKNMFSDSFSDDEQQPPSKKKKFTNEPLELSNRHIDRNTWIRYNIGPQENNNRPNNNQRNTLKSNKENCDIGKKASSFLSLEERNTIAADYRNSKLWAECLDTRINAKKEFLDLVVQTFICIICQDTVVNPITTECLHNYCLGCLRMAIRVGTEDGAKPTCPHCRHEFSLTPSVADINVSLRNALRTIMPGYDSRNK